MKKKQITALLLALSLCALSACTSKTPTPTPDASTPTPDAGPVVENFSAEYEMFGTTSAGLPKNDTFIFEGTTENGIIKTLNFDIIRNKGLEGEYSKKGIMGYMMNTSDAEVAKTDSGWTLPHMDIYGYEEAYNFGQYMVYASVENLTEDTTFGDLTIASYTGEVLDMERSLLIYQYLANEANITLTAETPVKDLLAIYGLYKDGSFAEGKNRVSFAGYHGGRSYGEQIDAIVEHILTHNMTLEDVYTMFQTVNQQSEPIKERDTVAGATIAFVGDFQRMVYLAIHGELFEGVVSTSPVEGGTRYEVVTQGYGGEMETYVVINDSGKIVSISVRDSQETPEVGGKLTADNSEFIQALIANQDDLSKVDAVAGATFTSKALLKAVEYAQSAAKQ
ncbi:MAG: FMN-binding protein [Oscillospiraceae bacterium]|nr:FMN-binding protein [Oscillospiraceae bacterium]